MIPSQSTSTYDDVDLILAAVIEDLQHICQRDVRQLPVAHPAARVAGQLRHLNRHHDAFTIAVNHVLYAIAEAIEELEVG